jgi:hypothetical protein
MCFSPGRGYPLCRRFDYALCALYALLMPALDWVGEDCASGIAYRSQNAIKEVCDDFS